MPTTILDDRSPSIVYSGSWEQGGTPREHEGTVSSSMTPGSSFTLKFTGSRIAVLGTLDASSAGVQTAYSIDGGTPQIVTTPNPRGQVYEEVFWRSPVLSQAEHTLKVEMVKVNPSNQPFQGTVWFDFVRFATTEDTSSSSAAPQPSQPSPAPSSPSPSPSPSVTTDPNGPQISGSMISAPASSESAVNTPADAEKKGTNIAPIVGGVIAALLVLLGITAIFLVHRHRKRKRLAGYIDSLAVEKGEKGGSVGSTPSPQPNNPASYPFTTPAYATPASTPPAGHYHPPPGVFPPPAGPGAGPGQGPIHLTYNPYAALPPGAGHSHNTSISASTALGAGIGYGASAAGGTSSSSSSGVGAPSQSFGRLFIANASAPGEDPDSIAALKRRQAETIAGNNNVQPPSQSQSSGSAAYDGVSTSTPATEDPDSVAALKRRQQEVVDSYNQGLVQGVAGPVVQHTDSGVRNFGQPQHQEPVELPPVYSVS